MDQKRGVKPSRAKSVNRKRPATNFEAARFSQTVKGMPQLLTGPQTTGRTEGLPNLNHLRCGAGFDVRTPVPVGYSSRISSPGKIPQMAAPSETSLHRGHYRRNLHSVHSFKLSEVKRVVVKQATLFNTTV